MTKQFKILSLFFSFFTVPISTTPVIHLPLTHQFPDQLRWIVLEIGASSSGIISKLPRLSMLTPSPVLKISNIVWVKAFTHWAASLSVAFILWASCRTNSSFVTVIFWVFWFYYIIIRLLLTALNAGSSLKIYRLKVVLQGFYSIH